MTEKRTQQKQLLIWPGVLILGVQWMLRFVLPQIAPDATPVGFFGGIIGWLAIVVWWVFLSRAPRLERWGAAVLMIGALAGTQLLLHVSIASAMQGMIFILYATPILSLAFVAWTVVGDRLSVGLRWTTMIASIFIACGVWTLLRFDGMAYSGGAEFAWRWSMTFEEEMLSTKSDETMSSSLVTATNDSTADWPGFLGSNRDAIIHGVKIEADWTTTAPVELWRQPVGPGWSSFAVGGGLFYTLEQRGDHEVVSCYNLATGKIVWRHQDSARFWEAIGGAGPRGTPTLNNGHVYALGATGVFNALDAHDGSLIWSRNVATDTGAECPYWGFAASPLALDDLVVVAASGVLVAYDLREGEPRWIGPVGGVSYSSPHLLTIDGVEQILIQNANGLLSFSPTDGALLWEYAWPGEPILQPVQTQNGDLLISAGQNMGLCRLGVRLESGVWKVVERWKSTKMKPYYSEIVVQNEYAFGFDGSILACVELEQGKRKWKAGRYGAGQLFLLADQNLLLILSETGELVLVAADPGEFKEIARFPALEGKTWNHPVLVGDKLLVRNAREMAAFRLVLRSDAENL